MQSITSKNSISLVKLGNRTKSEPIVNPIIPANVKSWKLSKKYLVNFIKINPPKINPIPIGIKIGKDRVAMAFKYIL